MPNDAPVVVGGSAAASGSDDNAAPPRHRTDLAASGLREKETVDEAFQVATEAADIGPSAPSSTLPLQRRPSPSVPLFSRDPTVCGRRLGNLGEKVSLI